MWSSNAILLLSLAVPLANTAPAASNSLRPAGSADYDVIIVGGGPSGIAALSALGRVGRTALLVDSAEYRNAPTRHMHDVPGFDGVVPSYYRWAAMQQISQYKTVQAINGTVVKIKRDATKGQFAVSIRGMNHSCLSHTARKIILGTGVRDLLPETPGLRENFGKGIYWCPWCDGMEHANQTMGILGSFENTVAAVAEISTLNSDIIIFANGTDTPENRAFADKKFAKNSAAYLRKHDVKVDNRTITRITRLRDGGMTKADPSLSSAPEYDLFRVEFDSSPSVERAVLFINYDSEQRSNLGQRAGVELRQGKMAVDGDMRTNVPGIYAVGDANSDNSTNVLHALYTGKRAVVDLHVELERETSRDLKARSLEDERDDEEEKRRIWARVNGNPGDLLYAGDY